MRKKIKVEMVSLSLIPALHVGLWSFYTHSDTVRKVLYDMF